MNNQKGFTLIEMLVVIAIVGLLSSVVVVGLSGAREKARDARRVADIRQIQNELEVNYTNVGGYAEPTSSHPPGQPKDPQDKYYLYNATSTGNFIGTYKLGIGLEGDGNNNYGSGSNCPSGITASPAFCVTPN